MKGKVAGFEITAEYIATYIENGRPSFAEARVSDIIDIRIKDAGEGMAGIIKNGEDGTYDIAPLILLWQHILITLSHRFIHYYVLGLVCH